MGEWVHCAGMLLPYTNFINKPIRSNEYRAPPHRWGVSGLGVDHSREDCGPGWSHFSQGQDRIGQCSWLPAWPPPLQDYQRVSGIKSATNSHIDKMIVALFAQLQMLSPFPTGNATNCPIRFCTQCKSLSCLTDVPEKTHQWKVGNVADSFLAHCASQNIYSGTHY
jgi:hypothetical protein